MLTLTIFSFFVICLTKFNSLETYDKLWLSNGWIRAIWEALGV